MPDPNRWTHHVIMGSEEEIDAELKVWICKAAEYSASKK